MRRKLIALILAVVLAVSAFAVMPTTVLAARGDGVISKIDAYMADKVGRRMVDVYGGYDYKNKAWGCVAFAQYLWKAIFGRDYWENDSGTNFGQGKQTNMSASAIQSYVTGKADGGGARFKLQGQDNDQLGRGQRGRPDLPRGAL